MSNPRESPSASATTRPRAARSGGRSRRRPAAMRSTTLQIVGVAASLLALASCSSSVTNKPSASLPGPHRRSLSHPATRCAWPTIDSAATANTAAPDVAATEWLQSFVIQRNLKVVLSGAYPDAGYASFNVYSAGEAPFTSNGVGSSVARLPDRARSGQSQPVATGCPVRWSVRRHPSLACRPGCREHLATRPSRNSGRHQRLSRLPRVSPRRRGLLKRPTPYHHP